MSLFSTIRSDYKRYKPKGFFGFLKMLLFNYGFICTMIYRFNNYFYYKFSHFVLRKIVNFFGFLGLKFSQWLYGISIPHNTKIGEGLFLSHNGPIVINGSVELGANCNIGPMVVIGVGRHKGIFGCPKLGDRVWIGPGAKIFGPITIGNDVAIGANAVINFDAPDSAVVVAPKSEIINYNSSKDYISL
jgi:serine O-acetyltransferase